mgnify:CR=1 FL=1
MFKLLWKYTKDGWWAALLGPIFVILEVVFDAYIPRAMSRIIDVGITQLGGDMDYIVHTGITMVLLALGAAVTGILSGLFASIASARFVRNIRDAMYENIQTFDFTNIEKFPVSTIVTRLTSDMRQLRMAYTSIVRMLVRTPINLIVSAYMVFTIHSKMARIFFFIVPVLACGLYYISSHAHPMFVRLMRKMDKLNSILKENIGGIRVVKTFVREDFELEKFSAVSEDVRDTQRSAEKLVNLSQPFFEGVMYISMICVAWLGGNYIIKGSLSVGQFMSYISYVRSILFSLLGLSNALMMIVFAEAAVDRANELLDERPVIDDSNADPALEVENGDIEFRNVSFRYFADSEKDTLSNINLKIDSGEVIGILGTTGASKSTLVQLIPRLYDTTEGEIYVGGRSIRDYKLRNLRESVSMVLQKNVLFSGTITENMRWGNPNATMEEIIQACQYAQADDFIQSFPEKYETELGQGGVNVSGGQKQRLCIARALLKKPKIIILDDSTSAVDTDTDHRIQLALKEALGDMTTIIIAQRVASVKEADRIIIMDNGSIQDIGNHEELMHRNSVYRDLYQTQSEGVGE